MNSEKYVKIQKKSDGAIDPMGLPFWEYIYARVDSLQFETQVWFEGKIFDDAKYQKDYCDWVTANTYNQHAGILGMYVGGKHLYPPTGVMPNVQSPEYFKPGLSRCHSDLVSAVKVTKFFINNNEVTQQEFERIALLAGCEL